MSSSDIFDESVRSEKRHEFAPPPAQRPAPDERLRELRERLKHHRNMHNPPIGRPPGTADEGAWTAFDIALGLVDHILSSPPEQAAEPEKCGYSWEGASESQRFSCTKPKGHGGFHHDERCDPPPAADREKRIQAWVQDLLQISGMDLANAFHRNIIDKARALMREPAAELAALREEFEFWKSAMAEESEQCHKALSGTTATHGDGSPVSLVERIGLLQHKLTTAEAAKNAVLDQVRKALLDRRDAFKRTIDDGLVIAVDWLVIDNALAALRASPPQEKEPFIVSVPAHQSGKSETLRQWEAGEKPPEPGAWRKAQGVLKDVLSDEPPPEREGDEVEDPHSMDNALVDYLKAHNPLTAGPLESAVYALCRIARREP